MTSYICICMCVMEVVIIPTHTNMYVFKIRNNEKIFTETDFVLYVWFVLEIKFITSNLFKVYRRKFFPPIFFIVLVTIFNISLLSSNATNSCRNIFFFIFVSKGVECSTWLVWFMMWHPMKNYQQIKQKSYKSKITFATAFFFSNKRVIINGNMLEKYLS